jgi:tripartite-type tricarboxylate transporter receptor subunit TctC
MNTPRRRFLLLAAGAAALPGWSRHARAQAYPTRAVRLVVGYPAGGGVDITARLIGQWLSERLGQQFIIENRPGAGSNIAAEAVARAPADGYTIFLATTANAVNVTLYQKLSFDFNRDLTPVSGVSRVPLVVVINPTLPVSTIPEFIAYSKSHPGKINIANGGIGGADHVSGELFKLLTGASMIQVPYRGTAPALTDLLGGQVQALFASMPSSIEYIRSGQLRALAVTTAVRSEALPDLPTVAEFVPGFEASQWYGIVVPRGTPAEIIDRLNKETNAGLADPKLKARLAELGGMVITGSAAEFTKLVIDETEKWGKVVKASGARAD